MNVQVNYFGMIAEAVNAEREDIEIRELLPIRDLKEMLETKYPALKKMDYRIAVNHSFADDPDFELLKDSEVALLPPFAGG
jgi:molybdopterin converting factor small subunit